MRRGGHGGAEVNSVHEGKFHTIPLIYFITDEGHLFLNQLVLDYFALVMTIHTRDLPQFAGAASAVQQCLAIRFQDLQHRLSFPCLRVQLVNSRHLAHCMSVLVPQNSSKLTSLHSGFEPQSPAAYLQNQCIVNPEHQHTVTTNAPYMQSNIR